MCGDDGECRGAAQEEPRSEGATQGAQRRQCSSLGLSRFPFLAQLTTPETQAQSSLDLKNLSLEINRYKSQLVQSPERLKSSITEMQISLARESEELKALEGKERGMESKVKGLGRYEGVSCFHRCLSVSLVKALAHLLSSCALRSTIGIANLHPPAHRVGARHDQVGRGQGSPCAIGGDPRTIGS